MNKEWKTRRIRRTAIAVLVLAASIGGFNKTNGQSPSDVSPRAETTTVDASDQSAPPLVAALPGTDIARMVTQSIYISPFASVLGISETANEQSDLGRFYRSRGRRNLARVPEMFGDYRAAGYSLALLSNTFVNGGAQGELVVAAGTAGLRIAELNHALPTNRVWFAYNHYHNALDMSFGDVVTLNSGGGRSQDVNRLSFGIERVLDGGRTSIELRMPFGAALNVTDSVQAGNAASRFDYSSDSVGNLSIILKRMLYGDACSAWSCGIGIETPTGSDATGTFNGTDYVLENGSVQLVPYLAYTQRGKRAFGHAFLQLDTSLSSDELIATNAGNSQTIGELDRGTTFGMDFGLGWWLARPDASGQRGLAFLSELHYMAQLDDADPIVSQVGAVTLRSDASEFGDLLNLTNGLEYLIGNGFSARVGVATPIRRERTFDTEWLFQLTRTL